jgi:hypothetical protein
MANRAILSACMAAAMLIVGCASDSVSENEEANGIVDEELKSLPPQGVYDSCRPADPSCLENLRYIGSAGFKVVVNYGALGGTAAEVSAYANAAHAHGVRVAWPLNVWTSPYGAGGQQTGKSWDLKAANPAFCPECSSNEDFVTKAVTLLRSHPGTWGWYIGDEIAVAGLAATRRLARRLEHLAPKRPRLFVARPNKRKLKPFIASADFAGIDPYPIASGPGCLKDPEVGPAAEWSSKMVRAKHRKPVIVLQSFSWSIDMPAQCGERWPTTTEMKRMRNAAIRRGNPSLILWFCYHCIRTSTDPAQHWANLKSAAF